MKKILLNQEFKGLEEEFKKTGTEFSIKQVWRNLFALAVQTKYQKGVALATNRIIGKIDDSIAEAVNDFELSDEQFDVLFDIFTTTEMPSSKAVVEIADCLELVKFGKAKEVAGAVETK